MTRYASLALFVALFSLWSLTLGSPYLPVPTQSPGRIANRLGAGLAKRQDDQPQFPDEPPSCPICAENYGSINSCAQAAPVLQNFTNIIFNPGAFIDIIKCACADTFQSTYPQCVDCFIRTNQTHFLNDDADQLPSVVDGMRKICALESTLLGGVQSANGEVTPTSSVPAPTPTGTNGAVALSLSSSLQVRVGALAVLASLVALLL